MKERIIVIVKDRITVKDLRIAISKGEACTPGAIEFANRYGFGWKNFVKRGIPVSDLEKIDDEIIRRIIQIHKERINGRK